MVKYSQQFVSNLHMNYLSVFDHFVILLFKGLKALAVLSDTTARGSAVH